MSFKDIVEAAKLNTPKKIFRREEDIKNLIDCSSGHAEYMSAGPKVSLEECKFLKKGGAHNFCTEYLCYCTGEKCNRPMK